MLGVLVNTGTVILGALLGLLLKKGLPQKMANALTTAVGLAVLYIGIDGALEGHNTLVLVLSLAIGALIGTLLDLDRRVHALGDKIEKLATKGNGNGKLAEGFVSASLLFCVGAMTVVGSLQSGLSGNHEMLFTKSILDFISSIVLASALGAGVLLSSVSVLVLQGSIALLAQFIAPYLGEYAVAEMTCAGSVLIIALALNLLKITDIKIMNFLPAVFLPILLCMFM